MKTLLISNQDASVLQTFEKFKSITKYLLQNAKKSKFNYSGKETDDVYFYVKMQDKEFTKLGKELIDVGMLSFAFRHQLVSKNKKKDEINDEELPF